MAFQKVEICSKILLNINYLVIVMWQILITQQLSSIENLLLICSWNKFVFVTVVPRYFNFATFSKCLLAIFMSWWCPAFWWRDSNTYLVCSVCTSRPISSLASSRALCFSLRYICHFSSDSRHQHRQELYNICVFGVGASMITLTVSRCVGIAWDNKHASPETEGPLSNSGWDETFPKQRIAEDMRSNLDERCPVSGPENTYLSPDGQRQENDRASGQRQSNCKVIIIVQCKSDRSLKTRYILTKWIY
jgi:hypothetical protein